MIWKIYFWFISFFLFLSYIKIFSEYGFAALFVTDLIISVPAIVGLFLYAYKKILFTARFWKTYFAIDIMWDFYLNLYLLPHIEGKKLGVEEVGGFLFILPIWIALYMYAFKFLHDRSAD